MKNRCGYPTAVFLSALVTVLVLILLVTALVLIAVLIVVLVLILVLIIHWLFPPILYICGLTATIGYPVP
jgi:hypothetical protein